MSKIIFNRVLVLLLVVLVGTPLLAQDTLTRMTLDEAVAFALQNNNSVKNSTLGIKDAEAQILATKATGLPQVSAELGYNFFYQRPGVVFPRSFGETQSLPYENFAILQQYVKDNNGNPVQLRYPQPTEGNFSFVQRNNLSGTIAANQLIFSGSYTVALKAADLARQLAAVQLSAKQEEVRNQVTEAYLPTLLLSESIVTLDNNIKNLQKLLNEVRETYKAGFVEQLDVDRLELSLNNLITERENIVRQREVVLNVLKMVIGWPLDRPLETADNLVSLLSPPADSLLTGAIDVTKRAEYQVIRTGEQLQTLNIELNKAGYLPTVVGFANWTGNLNSNNYFSKDEDTYWLPQGIVGVKATVNIWDSREKKHKIERAKIALSQLQLQKSDFERGVTLQVMNARLNYTNAQKRLDNQLKNQALALRIYNTTARKYKEGVGSSLEITTAEQSLYTAQQNVRQAQFDLLTAQKTLLRALGTR